MHGDDALCATSPCGKDRHDEVPQSLNTQRGTALQREPLKALSLQIAEQQVRGTLHARLIERRLLACKEETEETRTNMAVKQIVFELVLVAS